MPWLDPKSTELAGAAGAFTPAQISPELPYQGRPSAGEAFDLGLEASPMGGIATSVTDRIMSHFDTQYQPHYDTPRGWNVFDHLAGTPYADYADAFIHVETPADAEHVKGRIDRELWRKEQMANVSLFSGAGAANLAGGLVGDPTIVWPVGEVTHGLSVGAHALESGIRTGVAGAGAATASEAIQQATQETRMPEESALNVAYSAVLGAGLGAAVGAVASHLSPAEHASGIEDALDQYSAGSVGAAQAGANTTLGQEGMKSAFGVEKLLTPTSPLMRAAASPSIVTRRTMQQLAEDALVRDKNTAGIASEVSVTRRIEMHKAGLADGLISLDDAFTRYRLGQDAKAGVANDTRLGAADLTGQTDNKLTRREFAEEVGRAMIRNDTHDIPEVAQVAQSMRRNVFDPLKDQAIELGMLPPDVESSVAASYLNRVYDQEKIAARRKAWTGPDGQEQPGFEDIITSWLGTHAETAGQNLSLVEAAITGNTGEIERLKTEIHGPPAGEGGADATPGLKQQASESVAFNKRTRDQLAKADQQHAAARSALSEAGTRQSAAAARHEELLARQLAGAPIEQALADPVTRADIRAIRKGLSKPPKEADVNALAAYERRIGAHSSLLIDGVNPKKASDAVLASRLIGHEDAAPGRTLASSREATARLGEAQAALRNTAADVERLTARVEKARAAYDTAQAERGAARDTLAVHGRLVVARQALARAEGILKKATARAEELRQLAGLEPTEIRSIATDVTDKILGNARGGFTYDAIPLDRGPVKQLTLTIPTVRIEDFLHKDIDRVAHIYHRVMSTDIELTRMFGRADMEPALAKVRDDYALLRRDVTDPVRLAKMDKQLKRDLRDLSAVRDRIRGTYAMPLNPNSLGNRIVRTTKTINFLRALGGMTIASLPDSMRPVMIHGPRRFLSNGMLPLIANSAKYRLAAHEAKLAGAALEMVLDGRAQQIGDMTAEFAPTSKFERGMQVASNKFGLLTLMNPWTAFWKRFSGVIGQTRTLEATRDIVGGTAKAGDIERLANLGIDENMAHAIHEQFVRHGEDQGTLKWANSGAWDDPEAVLHFRAALGKEIDKAIVTPGQEKPLWMSSQLGSVLGQFQSYNISAMQRVLISGLQQRDASALAGFAGMTAAGMLVYWLQHQLRGLGHSDYQAQPLSSNPGQWIYEGMDRGGAFGYAFSFDQAIDVATRGEVSGRALFGGETLSRYRARTGITGFLGPTVGLTQDILTTTGNAAAGDLSPSDVRTMRRMIPLNNVFYWRWLFNEAEDGASNKVR